MKKKLLFTFALLLTAATGAWADGSWTSGGCDVTLVGGTLTVSKSANGNGAMANYTSVNDQPWKNSINDITSVVIGDDVTTIGNYAFYGCENLTSVTIGSNVGSIGTSAFTVCQKLASVSIPASVTNIGDYAFVSCGTSAAALVVTIADGSLLSSIGVQAFFNANLASFNIPASVTTIGLMAFVRCSNLTAFTVENGNTTYSSDGGVLFNKAKTTLIQCPGGKSGSYEIPASVTAINGRAFWGCYNLTSVTLGSNVGSIGIGAFRDCNNLITVTVYAPSCTIENETFLGCNNLSNVYVPSDKVEWYNTNWGSKVNNATIEAMLPSGTTGDVNWQLSGPSGNYTLTISGTGATPGYDVNTEPWHSYKDGITSVVIGNGVTGIGQYAFSGYSHITSLTIGNDLQTIGVRTFENCTGLTSVILPATMTSVGDMAFGNCSNLSTVIVRATSVPTCDNDAFAGNKSTGRKIYVPTTSYNTYTTTSHWSDYADDIIGFNGTCGATGHEWDVLWALTGESPNYTLNIMKVGETGAMAGYDWNTMPWVSNKAAITSVVIGDGVTEIGKYTFNDHTNLASVTIGSSLQSIGDHAFSGCSSLASVTLPSSMTSIGSDVFFGCSNLSTVIVRASSVPTCQNNAFGGNKEGRKIYVPATSANTYKATSHWSDYQNDIIGYYGTGGPTGHTLILHAAVPVTCTTAGNNEYWECVECHKYFSDENGTTEIAANSWVIDALGHTLSAHPAVAATCTEAGNSAYWECTVCHKYFSNSEGTNEIAENSWVILATGHTLTAHAAVAATCTTAGNTAYWECEICHKYFSDENGVTEIAANSWVIPATGHTIVSNICTGCGKYGYCGTSGHASDVTWELTGTSPNYTLNISGTGAMTKYDTEARPWCSQRTEITSVIIGNGVTGISQYAFDGCSNLASVTIGNNLETIGVWAFNGCTNLTSVILPASVKSIGDSSFSECNSLTSVTLNSNPQIQPNAFPGTATVTMNLTANPVGDDKWMTFFNDRYNFKADENTTVYKGTLSGSSVSLTEVADKIVTAGNAVILKSTGNPVMTLYSAASSDGYAAATNDLQGVSNVNGMTSNGSIYVLNNGKSGVGFYKLKSGKTLGYGKAYLSGSNAPSYLNFEEDETTSLSEELRMKNEEFATAQWYTLEGRKLIGKPSTKGMYIVNGKKVIIK